MVSGNKNLIGLKSSTLWQPVNFQIQPVFNCTINLINNIYYQKIFNIIIKNICCKATYTFQFSHFGHNLLIKSTFLKKNNNNNNNNNNNHHHHHHHSSRGQK